MFPGTFWDILGHPVSARRFFPKPDKTGHSRTPPPRQPQRAVKRSSVHYKVGEVKCRSSPGSSPLNLDHGVVPMPRLGWACSAPIFAQSACPLDQPAASRIGGSCSKMRLTFANSSGRQGGSGLGGRAWRRQDPHPGPLSRKAGRGEVASLALSLGVRHFAQCAFRNESLRLAISAPIRPP